MSVGMMIPCCILMILFPSMLMFLCSMIDLITEAVMKAIKRKR